MNFRIGNRTYKLRPFSITWWVWLVLGALGTLLMMLFPAILLYI